MARIITSNIEKEFKEATRQSGQVIVGGDEVITKALGPRKSKMIRGAQVMGLGGASQPMAEMFFRPETQRPQIEIPKDFKELVKWRRNYYATEPIVASAVELHCFPKGTGVLTECGVKNIEEIREGEKVLDSTGKPQWVLKNMSHKYSGDFYAFKAAKHIEFSTTQFHRLLVCRKTRKRVEYFWEDAKKCTDYVSWPSNNKEWVKAEDINIGDYLVVPKFKEVKYFKEIIDLSEYLLKNDKNYLVEDSFLITINTCRKNNQNVNRFINIYSEDFCRFLGWYVAEGYVGDSISIACGLSKKDTNEVINLVKRLFNIDAVIDLQGRDNVVSFAYAPLGRLLKELCGHLAQNKKIPEFLLYCADISLIKAFFQSYLKGDGCLNDATNVSYNTVSRILAYQLNLLGTKLGIYFGVNVVKRNIRDKIKSNFLLYTGQASRAQVYPIIFNLPNPNKVKSKRISTKEDADNFYIKVLKIKKSIFEGEVFDIATEDHSFLLPCVVHNSLIPFSTYHISHEDKTVSNDFEYMLEDINFLEFLLDMFLEFWIVGDIVPYGFFDDDKDPSRWTGFVLLDQTLVDVTWDPLIRGNRQEILKLKFSETIKSIVEGGTRDENTKKLYENLPADIINYVKNDQPMPLSTTQASHLKYFGSYHEKRGRSIIDRAFGWLMYRDKLKNAQYAIADRHICYDEETECLTKEGWKKYNELSLADEIAAVDKDTGILKYEKPDFVYVDRYQGDMLHFKEVNNSGVNSSRINIKVTPNHRMLLQRPKYLGVDRKNKKSPGIYGYTDEWEILPAEKVRTHAKFRGCIEGFESDKDFSKYVIINRKIQTKPHLNCYKCGKDSFETSKVKIPLKQYLKFVGYWISEGTVMPGNTTNSQKGIVVYQSQNSRSYSTFEKFFNKEFVWKFKSSTQKEMTMWNTFSNDLYENLESQFGTSRYTKKLPVWIKNLPPDYLKILLDALVAGDGSEEFSTEYEGKKYNQIHRTYYTISEQLANDVFEIVFKLGYVPYIKKYPPQYLKGYDCKDIYYVSWSETSSFGKFPIISSKKSINRVKYDGIIWCVKVPSGFFVTRREGRIAIQGNSPVEIYKLGTDAEPASQAEIDAFTEVLMSQWSQPNKAIVWHHALQVQWEGASGRILPLQPEFQYIDKQLF
ncbi:MAG: hypothetical protein WC942_08815, partial [Clostridia bacterium]